MQRRSKMSEVYKIDQKEELIGGRMAAMSPTASNHNRISRNILGIFWNYLQGKTCEPFGDGELVYLTEEDEFIPDFMESATRIRLNSTGYTARRTWWWRYSPPARQRLTGRIKRTFTLRAASGNIGLSVQTTKSSTFSEAMDRVNLFSTTPTPFMPTGS